MDLLTDRTKLITAVGGVTGLFLGIFGAREATRVAGRTIDRWLGTPRLVRTEKNMGLRSCQSCLEIIHGIHSVFHY